MATLEDLETPGVEYPHQGGDGDLMANSDACLHEERFTHASCLVLIYQTGMTSRPRPSVLSCEHSGHLLRFFPFSPLKIIMDGGCSSVG